MHPRLALTSARASPVTCRRFHRPCEEVVGADERANRTFKIVVRMRNLAHHAHRCALGRCMGTLCLWCLQPLHRRASLSPLFRFASHCSTPLSACQAKPEIAVRKQPESHTAKNGRKNQRRPLQACAVKEGGQKGRGPECACLGCLQGFCLAMANYSRRTMPVSREKQRSALAGRTTG